MPASDPRRRALPGCRFRRRRIVVRRGGFTLLEVMIALAILAITLVTLYQSQSQSISMATDSRFLTTASLLAQGRMAEIDAADPRSVVSGNGDFGDDYPNYTWRLEVSAVDELPLLKRFTLTVTQGKMATNNAYRLMLYKVVAQ
jgi:type II secretion system protein I